MARRECGAGAAVTAFVHERLRGVSAGSGHWDSTWYIHVAVKPLHGLDPSRAVHAVWIRDRVTPGIGPMVDALVAAARRRLGG